MTGNDATGGVGRGLPWRAMGWGAIACLLLLPLVSGAPWSMSDYVVMGGLLGGVGLLVDLIVRSSANLAYRAGATVAVLNGFLLIWVNLAVGYLGDEGNPANLVFLAVLMVGILGAGMARFRASGMARATIAAAVAQFLAGVGGLAAGVASPGASGIYEVTLGSLIFCTLWLLSAGLFHRAAGQAEGPIANG